MEDLIAGMAALAASTLTRFSGFGLDTIRTPSVFIRQEDFSMPALNGIDHVHVYVTDRAAAARWYSDVLGFTPVEAFKAWATSDGPLTIESTDGTVHLALFESDEFPHTSAIAFGTSGPEFLNWKTHLERHSVALRIADHTLAWSMYFSDPFDNLHEITTYDHALVRKELS